MSTNYVILDCDGGSDDAWALLLLLKAEEEKRLTLLGVTICGCGNTTLPNAARNMWRVLKACGREDIPIFLGAAEAIISDKDKIVEYMFHGEDGFGDILPKDDVDIEDIVEREHAVSAIQQFCIEHPNQVTVMMVGPLTNLALCYAMYSQKFADSIKNIYIMGGNHQGVGNYTRAAEFNFFSDPEAAHIVYAKSKCQITMLPWEPCCVKRFFINTDWRLKEFAAEAENSSEVMRLLNLVESVQYKNAPVWNPCDALLVAVYLFGSQFVRKESQWHVTVDLSGQHTRGQVVLDHLHEVDKYPKNVRIIELLDVEFFKRVARWAAGLADLKAELATVASNEG